MKQEYARDSVHNKLVGVRVFFLIFLVLFTVDNIDYS